MIVVDASVLACFWLERDPEQARRAQRARRRDADGHAPQLWRSEFRQVARAYLRAGGLAYADALRFAERAEAAMRDREHDVRTPEVLKLVERTAHSAYDCEYVAVAERLGVPLVTGDRAVARLFPETAVLLEDFAG